MEYLQIENQKSDIHVQMEYPLIENQKSDIHVLWVRRADVHAGRKEVGGYDKERLLNVRKAFVERGELTAIRVRKVGETKYTVVDGHHRLRVCEEYDMDLIPVLCEETTFKEAEKFSYQKKYVPPHKRAQRNSMLTRTDLHQSPALEPLINHLSRITCNSFFKKEYKNRTPSHQSPAQ